MRALPLLALLSLALTGCGSGDPPPAPVTTRTATTKPVRTMPTADERFEVSYEPTPNPIPRNQIFELEVTVVARGGAASNLDIDVDAEMPGHGHGMNTRPTVTRRESGHFDVAGMQFHMRGHWLLHVDVHDGAKTTRATFEINLE